MADSKKRGGGPNTPQGKANSSQNARKHGGTSKVLFLPGENPDDFEAIEAGWRKEFEPEGYQEERLVEILVLNDWFLKRAQRNLDEAEAEVFGGGGDFHRVELMQRYKTTHERAFYRALGALESLRKDIMREKMEMIRLQGRLERSEIEYERLRAQQKPEASQVEAPAARAKVTAPRRGSIADMSHRQKHNNGGGSDRRVLAGKGEIAGGTIDAKARDRIAPLIARVQEPPDRIEVKTARIIAASPSFSGEFQGASSTKGEPGDAVVQSIGGINEFCIG